MDALREDYRAAVVRRDIEEFSTRSGEDVRAQRRGREDSRASCPLVLATAPRRVPDDSSWRQRCTSPWERRLANSPPVMGGRN